jgi:hypothetical protein
LSAAKPIIFRRNDVIHEKTQAALSQIRREEKAAAADEVSPIVRHRASIAQPKAMGFAEPVIGPATSGRTRWFNPSYGLARAGHHRSSAQNRPDHDAAIEGEGRREAEAGGLAARFHSLICYFR